MFDLPGQQPSHLRGISSLKSRPGIIASGPPSPVLTDLTALISLTLGWSDSLPLGLTQVLQENGDGVSQLRHFPYLGKHLQLGGNPS